MIIKSLGQSMHHYHRTLAQGARGLLRRPSLSLSLYPPFPPLLLDNDGANSQPTCFLSGVGTSYRPLSSAKPTRQCLLAPLQLSRLASHKSQPDVRRGSYREFPGRGDGVVSTAYLCLLLRTVRRAVAEAATLLRDRLLI